MPARLARLLLCHQPTKYVDLDLTHIYTRLFFVFSSIAEPNNPDEPLNICTFRSCLVLCSCSLFLQVTYRQICCQIVHIYKVDFWRAVELFCIDTLEKHTDSLLSDCLLDPGTISIYPIPWIIARCDYFYFHTKKGLLFEGRYLFKGGDHFKYFSQEVVP